MNFPKLLKQKSFILSAAAVVLIVAAVWYFGFAPVMDVNGEKVGTFELMKVESAISKYNEVTGGNATSSAQIKKEALINIIDRKLLEKLVLELDPSVIEKAPEVVSQAIASKPELAIDEAAKQLYGLTAAEFTQMVLIPQAKRNLLAERFKDDPIKLETAWENIVATAQVKIFYPGFYWENGEVKIK